MTEPKPLCVLETFHAWAISPSPRQLDSTATAAAGRCGFESHLGDSIFTRVSQFRLGESCLTGTQFGTFRPSFIFMPIA